MADERLKTFTYFSGFEGGHGPGLDLHGDEPSPSGVLCLPHVHGEQQQTSS